MNKITKTLLIGSFAVMALCLLIFCLGIAGSSSARFHGSMEINGEHFIPLNKNAQSAEVSSSSKPYMFYKFTAKQKDFIAEFKRQKGSVALQVLIESDATKKKSDDGRFEFGFLYEDDFLSETELCPELKARNSIKGKFESLVENASLPKKRGDRQDEKDIYIFDQLYPCSRFADRMHQLQRGKDKGRYLYQRYIWLSGNARFRYDLS